MQLDALMGKDVSVFPHFTFSQSAPEPFSFLLQMKLQLKEKHSFNVIAIALCNTIISVSLLSPSQHKDPLSHTHT